MRIFIGCSEIANLVSQYTEGFKSLGHEVENMVFDKNPFYQKNIYTRVLTEEFETKFGFGRETVVGRFFVRVHNQIQAFRYMRELVSRTDVFVFISRSLLINSWDLRYLKWKRKKIVFINCGSEVRHVDPFCQEFGLDKEIFGQLLVGDSLSKKIRFIREIEKYADCIYSLPDQAGLSLRPYYHLKLPIKAESIVEKIPKREVPVIVHCPSKRGMKGTDKIESTLLRLKNEGVRFLYKIVENTPNEELLKILTDADLVIDELYFPGPGMLGLEAMAAGAVECTRHIPNIKSGWSPPVVPLESDRLYSQLKVILEDASLRVRLAEYGRRYVEEFHSPSYIAGEIVSNVLGNGGGAHYFPKFYLEKFIPSSGGISTRCLKESKKSLLLYGCSMSTNLEESMVRGVLPFISKNEIQEIPRWPDV